MTTQPPSLASDLDRPVSPVGPTLADLLDRLPGFAVPPQARQNMASAIRTLCRVLDRPPAFVPLAAATLRTTLDRAAPGSLGVSASRWRNVKSDVGRAIRLSGLATTALPAAAPLTDAWEAVARQAPDAAQRSVLRRFGRFCSARQQAPEAVDDATVSRYGEALAASQLSRAPYRSMADLIRAWNRHVAVDPVGPYRSLVVPTRSRKYTRDWPDLPAALRADVRAFHDASLQPDPFDGEARRAVRPATVYARDRLLRRLATAEIAQGVGPSELQSLADLVRPDRLKRGLRFFLDRNGGTPNQQVADVASLALSIATQWAKAPDAQLKDLRLWARKFRRQRRGLTDKNRARLRQFADRDVIRRLVALPDRLLAKARKQPVSARTALKAQTAVAIALLLIAPIRIGNLVRLDRHRHFHRAFSGKARVLQLVLPAAEVKNDVDLEYPVPAAFETLIDRYLTIDQPRLTNGHPSGLLFPGCAGAPKHDTALRRQITGAIRDEAGLMMNPHLFRHLAALLFLEHHPGHYEEVRRILGHKNINTTIQSYAGLETTAAVRRYDAMILDLRTTGRPDHRDTRRQP